MVNHGHLRVADFLTQTKGQVRGRLLTDAKNRYYSRDYSWSESDDKLTIQRADGHGDAVTVPSTIELTESLVAFLGLYSGDGSKGTEAPDDQARIIPNISFSQREPHLVRFAVDEFRRLFPGDIRFTFSLGEDSAYFMADEGLELLRKHYIDKGQPGIPVTPPLDEVRPKLDDADQRYLGETRPDAPGTAEEHLAFYYLHKTAMQEVLTAVKQADVEGAGITLQERDRATASLRRPFKKGARLPGGSSRSDELHVGGLNGLGELLMAMIHEVEDSLLRDAKTSTSGLVVWSDIPSKVGRELDIASFFETHPYGQIRRKRPKYLKPDGVYLRGQWAQSSEVLLNPTLRVTPLWAYTSGLYLAEGSTPKSALFSMFRDGLSSAALSFTSSEGMSLELILRALQTLFPPADCVKTWKVKVGSQYFPELVVTGLKHGVPMLRGGASGDGKLRTMEISLEIKKWALAVADEPLDEPSLLHSQYENKYSHVEPTGAGVARIDFSASSALCRWYFPLLMYSVFGDIVADPVAGFYA